MPRLFERASRRWGFTGASGAASGARERLALRVLRLGLPVAEVARRAVVGEACILTLGARVGGVAMRYLDMRP